MQTVLNRALSRSFTMNEGYSRLTGSGRQPTSPPPPTDHRPDVLTTASRCCARLGDQTLAGRLLTAGVALKLVAWAGGLSQWRPGVFSALDTLGGRRDPRRGADDRLSRLRVIARQRLLWRVRRKLILSYIFIGVVPVLLVGVFFTLGGLLFFFNVSAFMLRNHVASVVDGRAVPRAEPRQPTFEAASTARPTRLAALVARQTAAAARYPLRLLRRSCRRTVADWKRIEGSPAPTCGRLDPGATSRRRQSSRAGCRARFVEPDHLLSRRAALASPHAPSHGLPGTPNRRSSSMSRSAMR